MKKTLLTILTIVFSLFPAYAIKTIEANPINIAISIVEHTDSASIASDLVYYGYFRQQSQEGYNIFRHSNGSEIRYILNDLVQKYPTIEVKSNTTKKQRDQILKNLNFQKKGNAYERKYIGFRTRCTLAPNGTLIFTSH